MHRLSVSLSFHKINIVSVAYQNYCFVYKNENNVITINNTQYKLSDKENNHGVPIDKILNMFINAKVKSANYQLHNIRSIKKITINICKLLIKSLVLSILDYCKIL